MPAVVTPGEIMRCLSPVAVSTLEETRPCSGVPPEADQVSALKSTCRGQATHGIDFPI